MSAGAAMGATRMVVRHVARREWRSLAALGLLCALACGFALTALTGARRVHTSWPRLNAGALAPDALVTSSTGEVDEVTKTIRSQPDVAAAGAFSYFPASIEGTPGADQIGLFAGLGPGFGRTVWRPLIVRGRLPDPARADEITVNREYARLARVDVGDRVRLAGPGGLDQPARVVGIHLSPLDIGPNGGAPAALGTPAFGARWWPTLATLPGFEETRPAVAIRLRPGADPDAVFRGFQRELPDGTGIVDASGLEGDVVDGLRAATTAYLVLAVAAGAGALLVLSLLVARSMRDRRDAILVLGALGATRRQRALTIWAPQALAIAVGIAVAPLLATLASPLVRTGFAREADPVRGIWVDLPTLLGAAGLLGIALLVIAAGSAWRSACLDRDRDTQPARTSATRWARQVSPAAGVGAGGALGGATLTSRRLSRSAIATITVTMVCLVAAVVWASSARDLERDFALQGWNFDATLTPGPGVSAESLDAAAAEVGARPDIGQLTRYRQATVTVRGFDIDVVSLANERGRYQPVVVEGRAPAGANEIAMEPTFVRDGGTKIGDELTFPGADGNVTLTVVGEVVFPFIGNTGFGSALLMGDDTLARIVSEAPNSGLLVGLRPGADLDALERGLPDGLTMNRPSSPPPVARLLDASGIAAAVAAFFAVLGAGVFAFTIAAGTRRRRREYAITRAVGFDGRQVYAAVRWHAAIVALVCTIVALPVGIVVGRVVWRLSSRNLPIRHVTYVPVVGLGVAALVVGVFVVAVSALAAIGPARTNLAKALRVE